jgi:hypothetical protein
MMRVLNTQEIAYVSGALPNEVYEYVYNKSTQAGILLGIVAPIIIASAAAGAASTPSLSSIIGSAALGAAVAAPIGFGYCYIMLMSTFLYEEYSPIIVREINSYFNL